MRPIVIVILLVLTTGVQAAEVKIIETDEGISAEFTGTSSASESEGEKPNSARRQTSVPRMQELSLLVEQLQKEVDEILKLSGTETEEELAAKNALAAEKKRQIELYQEEMRQIAGPAQPKVVVPDQQKNVDEARQKAVDEGRKIFMKQRLETEERIRGTRELRKPNLAPQPQIAPQPQQ
jgi:hypothetical protein